MCSHVNFVVGDAFDKCLKVFKLKSQHKITVKSLVFRGVKIGQL